MARIRRLKARLLSRKFDLSDVAHGWTETWALKQNFVLNARKNSPGGGDAKPPFFLGCEGLVLAE